MPDQAGPLPYGRQWIDDNDIAAVVEVLRSDFFTTGPMVGRFERALCDYTGAGRAVAVNSGTAALHAAYFAAGLGPGDEIIASPMTFAATANAALYLGATVRFVDVEPDTGNIYAGHPADYDRINGIATDRGIKVVADAAHSFGVSYRGRRCGTLADATATSFHPVKPLTTAEGGAVLTDDLELADRATRFRTHGIVKGVPVHYHPYDQGLGYQRGAYPVAEDFYDRVLSLPIFPAMADDDVQRVIDTCIRLIDGP